MGFPVFGQPFGSRLARIFGHSGGGSGVLYTLLDQFTTAISAGAVNGTGAEPTGQTRTVTDTNSKLSIAGGAANFATGGVGAGDPGLWYPSMTRVVGLIVLSAIKPNGSGTEISGWSTSAVGIVIFAVAITNSGGLSIYDNGAIKTVGAGIVSGTTYQVAVILRSAGCFYFIKGGVFTNWTLLYLSVTGSAAMLPGACGIGTTDVFTADNIRVPVALYIPAPLAYDTFTRANGALGSTETTSPDGIAIAALTWLFTTGVWAVNGNKAVATPNLGADVIVNGGFSADTDWNKGAGWSIAAGLATAAAVSSDLSAIVAPLTVGGWYQVVFTVSAFASGLVQIVLGGGVITTQASNGTFTQTGRASTTAFAIRGASGFIGSVDNVSAKLITLANMFASVLLSTADVIADISITLEFSTAGKPAGLVLNLDSVVTPSNFIIVYLDGRGQCLIDECVAGVYANKQTTSITYSAGSVLRVERSGTELRVYYNNVAVGVAQTMTANVNRNHGLFSTSPLNSLDGFTLWARGTGNEYGSLDSL